MILGVLKEVVPGERRVALVPAAVSLLEKKKFEVVMEQGAGVSAGYTDEAYKEKGASIADGRDKILGVADAVLVVRATAEMPGLRKGQVLIGHMDPLSSPQVAQRLAATGATAFALELIPRITRAQSMDVLSSMATIAGYKAVLIAANESPRMFPLMMTAAGNITPARVFIVGVGVAGLQAIASARRLGAVVTAYDVRPAVKEQVQSLGAKFLELALDTAAAEDKGGYAKAMDEETLRRQREMMAHAVAESDVVITTAAVPGKKAPILVTAEMVRGMKPGSVVVDLAAERGGNCELTRAGETVIENDVKIMGPLNVPSMIPFHASQMYSTNVVNFLLNLYKKPDEGPDWKDQIVAETLVARDGDVVNARVRELLQLAPLAQPQPEAKEK
jgi:NAD(P) transhydrogenase subunit alpha